ncbi:dihydrolipoamide acetyltransferase family protein [Rhodonellum sp.]|uniref:dihydrolipoamide acetyltransferase family protein n=1 Tax=Rhodonellum sp. TaxID=2231180 RepID=UPI002722BA6E|nr:dihydrolipoamide acetyltransferase family protein [Rhodonellum sp.]MDO9554192.1 dihydrolipoamide acetyltransferase family protein [Rhodonellum sp.]
MIEFLMPSLGADMEDGTLVEWRKKPGDFLSRGDIIADVDTQKGLIEIEVFEEGVLEKLLVEEGVKVPVGTILALINTDGIAGKKSKDQPMDEKVPVQQPIEEKRPVSFEEQNSESKRIKASPLAKRIAEAERIDLSSISGTGENGAITKEDVENAIASREGVAEMEKPKGIKMEIAGEPEKGKAGTEQAGMEQLKEAVPEKKPMGTVPPVEAIRSAVAAAMSKSNREIPHYYLEKKIDMSKSLSWLKEANSERPVQKRLLPAALLIKAVALAVDEVPALNAVWENGLQLKNEINIGFVVSLRTGGIMVPAIHQADAKSVDEIMEVLNDVIPRARALKLRSSELSDSTITITNIGEGSADKVFGVIYPPQVAIIGFGGISEEPFAENGLLGIRPIVHVTLAGDHRATDGLTGSRFLGALNKYLQNPETL